MTNNRNAAPIAYFVRPVHPTPNQMNNGQDTSTRDASHYNAFISPHSRFATTTIAPEWLPSAMLFHNKSTPVTTLNLKEYLKWQSPTRTDFRPPIPLELFHEIFGYLEASQDDAFSAAEHMETFSSLLGVCKYFAFVARPVIWGSVPFCISDAMCTGFGTHVAEGKLFAVHLAGFVKKCRIGDPALCNWKFSDSFLEEDGFGEILAAALTRMRVEELTLTDVVITKRVLKLVDVVAPRLKVLHIADSCCLSGEVSDDELRAVFGAMRGPEELKITGRSSQCCLMQSPSMIPVSNLRRLYTDSLFTIDSCIAQGAALTHLEIGGMHVSSEDASFLHTRLQSFPSLTHIEIHNVINTHFGRMPMEIPVGHLANLISFKAPPGLLPKFLGLGPKLEVLNSTGTNSEEPYADSSHPFLDPSSADSFTTTNIRDLVVFDCNLNSQWVVPPVNKPVPNLRVMRVIYTGTADHYSNEYTVPKMFEELGTMCEARTTRFPVEELVITFDEAYFTHEVGRSRRDCSWVVDLEQQLEMIAGLSDGLPRLKRVFFHGGFVAWAKDEEDGSKWGPRMLNAKTFDAVTRIMAEVDVVDYMACLEPFWSAK
ncbi:hypothetical protein BDZ89DRAFT_1130877 [Hymenopellis radicata]|nr:hypothetical protein BDZ89DRAFT_1130877 [Hymenopellis radicata]